jgi:hypothetical protein
MNEGISAARRALGFRKGPPTESDRPPLSVFSGKRHKLLAGQLDIFGEEHTRPKSGSERAPAA